MNIKNIKELAEIVCRNGLTKLEVCEGETKVSIEKACTASEMMSSMIVERNEINPSLKDPSVVSSVTLDFNHITEVKSPIVGVFYSASSPEAEPFVTIGSKVKNGDVLCMIEAMKLMNEITAECDGEIVDICLKNGDIAEYGQVLFKIF